MIIWCSQWWQTAGVWSTLWHHTKSTNLVEIWIRDVNYDLLVGSDDYLLLVANDSVDVIVNVSVAAAWQTPANVRHLQMIYYKTLSHMHVAVGTSYVFGHILSKSFVSGSVFWMADRQQAWLVSCLKSLSHVFCLNTTCNCSWHSTQVCLQ